MFRPVYHGVVTALYSAHIGLHVAPASYAAHVWTARDNQIRVKCGLTPGSTLIGASTQAAVEPPAQM